MGQYRAKICKVCKVEYRTNNENYCSRKCYNVGRLKPRIEGTCEQCDKHYVSKYTTTATAYVQRITRRYCSTECRIKGQSKGRIESPCKTCGKIRMLYPSDVKLGRGNYCSKKCAGRGNSGFRKDTLVHLKCKVCSKDFTRERWRFKGNQHTGDYCSQACHYKAMENPLSPLPTRQEKEYVRLRKRLLSEHDACTKCGSQQRLELDHIVPLALAPGRAKDETNLQVLCKKCHDIKTKEDLRYILFLRS